MAFKIPKIQYKNQGLIATTSSGSPNLTDISDTDNLDVGMLVSGPGVPAGTTLLSVGSGSAVMSNNANSSNVADSYAFHHEINFDYPPIEPKGEIFVSSENVSTSLSGKRQVSVNHIEARREMVFSHLSHAKKLLFESFILNWAIIGKDFRYFDDRLSGSYVVYGLTTFDFSPTKISPKGEDQYVWSCPFNIRRAL